MTRFTLSFAAIDILLERLELGLSPFPFEIPRFGQTLDERAGIRKTVLEDLEQQELVEEAERAVRLFARPEIVITAFGRLDGGAPLTARICSRGQRALCAIGEVGGVRFGQIRPTAVVATAVGLLPEERRGPGQPMILSPAAAANGNGFTRAVHAADTGPAAQLYKAQTLLRQEKLRLGQFRVGVRDRRGRESHGADLFWFDTTAGRYTVASGEGRDGQSWTTFSPSDNGRIEQLLSKQLATLRGD